jgi:putative FmdB family regulatory protein
MPSVPTYDYQCRQCGRVTEVIHSMLEEGPTTCEHCGGPLRRVLHPAGIIFKGSGFYRTDSRSGSAGSKSRAGDSESGSKPKPAKGSEAGSSGSGSAADKPAATSTESASSGAGDS